MSASVTSSLLTMWTSNSNSSSNSNNTGQTPKNSIREPQSQPQQRDGLGPLKALLSRARSSGHLNSQSQAEQPRLQLQPQQQYISNGSGMTTVPSHPPSVITSRTTSTGSLPVNTSASASVDDFLPNPKIPDSPTNTPPRAKTWEGAYRNFLSRGSKASSPNTTTSDASVTSSNRSPKSSLSSHKSPDTSADTATKRSSFSLLPGTKRLVSRVPLTVTPQSAPDYQMSQELDDRNMPNLPALSKSGRRRADSLVDFSHQQRKGGGGGESSAEGAVRGGKLFHSVFKNRSSSAGTTTTTASTSTGETSGSSLTRRRKSSRSANELDHVLRKGVEKGGSPLTHNIFHRKQAPPPPPPPQVPHQATLQEEEQEGFDEGGLDSLLASASSSPHLNYATGNYPRPASHHSSSPHLSYATGNYFRPAFHHSSAPHFNYATGDNPRPASHQMMHPLAAVGAAETEEDYSVSWSEVQPGGLIIEDDDDNDDAEAEAGADNHPSSELFLPRPQRQGTLGSLLAQQLPAVAQPHPHPDEHELDTRHYHNHHYNNHHTMHSSEMNESSNHDQQQQQQQEKPIGNLQALLQNPNFTVSSSPSSMLMYQHQQANANADTNPPNPIPNPEMKKAFTNFHNQARFARDATSPFLGEASSASHRHDSYVSYHMMMMRGGGASVPQHAYSERDVQMPVNVSTSLPLETVDEHNMPINKSMRLLKPIEGTDTWQQGRRYLIAPAALAACPLTVINKLSGSFVQTATEATTSKQAFGMVNLGECFITYVGDKHHLSLGKWSSCRLVLRQNYLLEFDTSTPITGLPRGFVHLQHAVAYKHGDFQDAFELRFYASPCAKSDQRVLMVRVKNREERDDWITCLNNAAQLRVEDLWEFDTEFEFGQGRFASVYPARRKTHKYFESGGGHEAPSIGEGNPDRASLLKRCDCAIKVVDKNQFWRRVVKGRERSDTLVREPSVQSTLTAKCGRVPTFLQLRGFFETSDSIVMELELLEGTDLFEYVSSKGVLGEDEAALIAKDILTSLDAMNRVGLAHRDIKPANILMCRREKDGVSVKVGDFGMSTFVGVDGLVRGRCGTPGYVAPEILTAASLVGYGNKVDIFSAGVTLYVMLCGYEPFYGENEKELIEANKRGVIDFPESDWGEVSKEARDLVLKMTAANPLDRVNAKEALQHPWITRLESEESESSAQSNIKTIALNASDSPEEGGCVIS